MKIFGKDFAIENWYSTLFRWVCQLFYRMINNNRNLYDKFSFLKGLSFWITFDEHWNTLSWHLFLCFFLCNMKINDVYEWTDVHHKLNRMNGHGTWHEWNLYFRVQFAVFYIFVVIVETYWKFNSTKWKHIENNRKIDAFEIHDVIWTGETRWNADLKS